MTKEESIKAALARHPDWDDARITNSLSKQRVSIKETRLLRAGQSLPLETKVESSGGVVSLKKIIERYDVRSAVIKELAAVPRGSLIVESELCVRVSGSDRNRFRRTVENNADELRPYRVKLRLDDSSEGKWYWGHPEDVAEAQKIKDL